MNEARGLETMSPAMSQIRNYYDWLYDRVRPFLGDSVLEIGPGYGSMAERILKEAKTYRAIDTDAGVISHMAARFPQLQAGHLLVGDITSADCISRLQSQHADSVLSMNVLEHLADDGAHLKSLAASRLSSRFIFVVPAMKQLYGSFDRDAGHYRRYGRTDLRLTLEKAGMKVLQLSYFNAMGAISWWIAAKILKMPINNQQSEKAIVAYDKIFIPAARVGEPLLHLFMGQSLIAITTLP